MPDVLRADKGPEFLGAGFVEGCERHAIAIDYIESGEPNKNRCIERFNGSFCTEVLDAWLFRNLNQVREISSTRMLEYDKERDHNSLGGMTSEEV